MPVWRMVYPVVGMMIVDVTGLSIALFSSVPSEHGSAAHSAESYE
jgi:hypothetical protein